ncbi:hypothetical protein PUN28_002824 [Cardiocondyla obscurior]|uniref:Uncharacterized protein n=1 Tax=Cardiocondyla obscurior TaxID=286306 RepID=A0AAW2GW70_9HYME
MPVQKRVNLAEGTSIIGQRPGKLFTACETARHGFQQAQVLNRCPLRRAVFADVVRLQRRWLRHRPPPSSSFKAAKCLLFRKATSRIQFTTKTDVMLFKATLRV